MPAGLNKGSEIVKDCIGIGCLLDYFYRRENTRLKEISDHIFLSIENCMGIICFLQVI